MGLGHGADIVRNGLVLHLDAANVKSYPGKLGQELVTNSLITKKDGVTFNVLRTPTENITLTLCSVVAGKNYIITYTITSYTGSVGATVRINGNGVNLTPVIGISSVGTFTATFNALVSGSLSINGDNTGTNFNVDFVSVKEMLENTGTTWNDLSVSTNNGILVNGIGYNNANTGSMVFDGVNDYISTSKTWNNIKGINWNGYITIEGIFKVPQTPTNSAMGYFGFTSSNAYFKFMNTGNLFLDSGSTNPSRVITNCITSFSNYYDTWIHVCAVYDGIVKTYHNGLLQTTSDAFTLADISSLSFIIGDGMGYYNFQGNNSNIKVYNRALSSTEVKQNFEATRGRYGI